MGLHSGASMSIKSFLPHSICSEAVEMGAAYETAQRTANASGRLAVLHSSLGNQEILHRITTLRPEETAGQTPGGDRTPVAAVMSSGGMTVSDYIDQPGLLVADAWLTELPLVASGRGSISGDAATLVQASDLFECEDAATCSRHINRDLGLLQALLPGAAQSLQSRLQRHAEVVLSESRSLQSSAGGFALAADTGIRALAAGSGVSAVVGAAVTATLHTAIRSEISARILDFTAREWAPEDICSRFLRCFVDAWMISFADQQKALEDAGDFEGLQGFSRWMRVLSTLQYGELRDHFQGAILEPFFRMASQTVPAVSRSQHTHGSLSGVYNFTLVFTLTEGQVVPAMLGLPTALTAQDAELMLRLPGLWQSQTLELISADQDLILWVCGNTVTITKAGLGADRDLQALGAAAPESLDDLRLQASAGDQEAQDTLSALEQRGAEKLWACLLAAVGPDSCIQDVSGLQILRRA